MPNNTTNTKAINGKPSYATTLQNDNDIPPSLPSPGASTSPKVKRRTGATSSGAATTDMTIQLSTTHAFNLNTTITIPTMLGINMPATVPAPHPTNSTQGADLCVPLDMVPKIMPEPTQGNPKVFRLELWDLYLQVHHESMDLWKHQTGEKLVFYPPGCTP
ncbi:hypothetical protein M422DRAFT_267563 [Sphaerobolus stellatus SS14]|uniref:Uncharacterized protein n=1 Tax=Sphaerobolus stellatus (strain SS14) TaxID=990650 RepID=A0A0C9UZR2_SPHS4|nr:hypothetical protein M422DRAFT_267563 [Sphaerobolus stellatus SS14]